MIPRMTTKDLIIEVAGRLFMDKGFKATSTREIAEQAGITQPNLYHHFKTKEAIYIAVLENLSLEVKDDLEEIVRERDKELVEKLNEILDYLQEKHPVNFFIMSHDMTHEISSENHQHLYTIWQESYLRPIIYLFEQYLEEDDSPISSRDLARHYYATIAPLIQNDRGFYKELSSEQIIELFVYGILNRE